jgi:hypothetical protein
MFVTVVIGEIFAIETIYTKTVNSRGGTRILRYLRHLAAYCHYRPLSSLLAHF